MATNNISNLDFLQIKTNLKEYLRSKPEMADYDFEASGFSYLLDLLAFNTQYTGYYLNMVANEMFLDSAVLRESVVSRAKNVGYIPRSKKSAAAKVQVQFRVQSGQPAPAYISVPRTATLTARLNNKTYVFNVTESYTVEPDGDGNFIADLDLIEGDRLTFSFDVNNNDVTQRFIIPNPKVDIDTILVSVQDSAYNLGVTYYSLATDITQLTQESKVYFLQEVEQNKYEVYFGDDIISYKPKTGNIVNIEYIVSNGSAANSIKSFSVGRDLGIPENGVPMDSPIITMVNQSAGGDDEESIQSIKSLAPLSFEVQNRGVTKSDFEYIILHDYPYIDSVSVWGGEDNDPPLYGHVFFSMKPAIGFVLDEAEKTVIINDIIKKKATLCQIPRIVDPEYVHVQVLSYVRYDYHLTHRTSAELQRDIITAILSYGEESLSKFNRDFIYSNLISDIDAVNSSIISNLTTIKMRTRIYPTLDVPEQHIMHFGNQLDVYDPSNFYSKAIISTEFIYNSEHCVFAEKTFESEILSIFKKTTSGSLEEIEEAGSIDYIKGVITIDQFILQAWLDHTNYIDFIVKPRVNNLTPLRNQIFIIEPDDVKVIIEAVR